MTNRFVRMTSCPKTETDSYIVVKSKIIVGVAVVAYPAVYGNSGVMTFVVNHEGVVCEKDLGKNTAKTSKAMSSFDPDKTWKEVE